MKYKINYSVGGAAAQPEATQPEPGYIFINKDQLINAVNLWCSNDTGRREATNRYGHISTWNVSRVTSMSHLFRDKETFNDDISSWNVSSVTNMSNMFEGARSFNQPLNSWDVSSVVFMIHMFRRARS